MADTDRYAKITGQYADELRDVAERLDDMRRRLDELGPDRQTWPEMVELVSIACDGLREKARSLDDLPALAPLWDDQEGR